MSACVLVSLFSSPSKLALSPGLIRIFPSHIVRLLLRTADRSGKLAFGIFWGGGNYVYVRVYVRTTYYSLSDSIRVSLTVCFAVCSVVQHLLIGVGIFHLF